MTLAEYIKQSGLNQTQFGLKIGRTQGFVSDLCAAKARPSIHTLIAIEQATNGAVTAKDFLPQEDA